MPDVRPIDANALTLKIIGINCCDYGSMFDYTAHKAVIEALNDAVRFVDDAPTLAYTQQLEQEKFDVLDEISSAYYGKTMYGLNDDGTVYSRYSCDTMTFDEAVSELAHLLYREVE